MDELDNNKLKPADDEREVESEEKQRGEEIEVDEDRLPSRAMAIHEHIRQEGEKEMERDALALLWSAIAAGLSMGASLLAKGFSRQTGGDPGRVFTGKSRVYLRLYYRDHGPPAAVHGKYGYRRSAGDAQSHPR